MTRKSIAIAFKLGAVAFLLFMLLFADGIWATSPSFIGFCIREIADVCLDSTTQWMLVLCLVCYFIIFLLLEWRPGSIPHPVLPLNEAEKTFCVFFRGNIFNPNFWLFAFVVATLLRYALTYETALRSMQVPVLMTGIVFGKAVSTCVRWQRDKIERRAIWLICSLVYLLATSALWQPDKAMEFQYHGIHRWSGVWDNPNLYGLLMGVGIVLAAGQIDGVREKTENRKWKKILCVVLYFIAAVLCGIGLFKSYSRGAWLAVLAGLIYLAVQAVKSSRFSIWFHRNRLPLILMMVSLSLLTFWEFRFSESLPAQRIFSAGNINDLSWRNRVTAWEGAVRMMVDRPFIGFGWGQAESDYSKKYLSPRLDEGAAIEMNDYFMIGISAGVPALICFGMYLWLALRRKTEGGRRDLTSVLCPPSSVLLSTTYHAGAIVLLVGFWFDGGLFKLPVAVVFWTLIELGRIESVYSFRSESARSFSLKNENPLKRTHVSCYPVWLRWLVGILALVAFLQTIVYLGTPLLSVNNETLAIMRKCLVPPKQKKDFEFLAAQPIWHGEKLKTLLEHVELANYNRELINWQLEDKIYRDFVLSPVITGNSGEQLNWRRPLWEEFYPRIRHESSPEDAAKIVVRHLRERVTIATPPNPPHNVPIIWLKQITDEAGFETIYVAALRSVGVPARLNSSLHAEFWDGNKWQIAPSP